MAPPLATPDTQPLWHARLVRIMDLVNPVSNVAYFLQMRRIGSAGPPSRGGDETLLVCVRRAPGQASQA